MHEYASKYLRSECDWLFPPPAINENRLHHIYAFAALNEKHYHPLLALDCFRQGYPLVNSGTEYGLTSFLAAKIPCLCLDEAVKKATKGATDGIPSHCWNCDYWGWGKESAKLPNSLSDYSQEHGADGVRWLWCNRLLS